MWSTDALNPGLPEIRQYWSMKRTTSIAAVAVDAILDRFVGAFGAGRKRLAPSA